jgi:hypothetical protein
VNLISRRLRQALHFQPLRIFCFIAQERSKAAIFCTIAAIPPEVSNHHRAGGIPGPGEEKIE